MRSLAVVLVALGASVACWPEGAVSAPQAGRPEAAPASAAASPGPRFFFAEQAVVRDCAPAPPAAPCRGAVAALATATVNTVAGASLQVWVSTPLGAPLGDCALVLLRRTSGDEREARAGVARGVTDHQGCVHFDGLCAGTWQLRSDDPLHRVLGGAAPIELGPDERRVTRATVDAPEARELLRGEVRDELGNHLAAVNVHALDESARVLDSATTDAAGRFAFRRRDRDAVQLAVPDALAHAPLADGPWAAFGSHVTLRLRTAP